MVLSDENMAAAVIDRLVHNRRLLQFRAQSYRVKKRVDALTSIVPLNSIEGAGCRG